MRIDTKLRYRSEMKERTPPKRGWREVRAAPGRRLTPSLVTTPLPTSYNPGHTGLVPFPLPLLSHILNAILGMVSGRNSDNSPSSRLRLKVGRSS